ncbi:helix-turn-helix domain-containing protein [Aquimarina aggregata]|uniref:helix-turn-helix domain-containing protein n=1 Tax=Aquimarina aggregata TaxID=1642818 RepID=UPI002492CA56|nr:winged helix-turn-helix domain-containing protein [Aquimarina aggregata]
MNSRCLKIVPLFFILLVLPISRSVAQDTRDDSHIEVSLRMIGHKVLLSVGDSISRVLPIIKENNRYKIQFESEFEFTPEKLVETVDHVVKETELANHYIVEVEQCKTKELVYSFKMNFREQADIIPCKTRTQPKSCYNLIFVFTKKRAKSETAFNNVSNFSNESNTDTNTIYYSISIIIIFLLTSIFYFLKKKKLKRGIDSNIVSLGDYHFDKRNTELLIKDQIIELTNKEADLLILLYNAVNTTVRREVILNMVWEDEGGYVGRTLDVFISKLRKKLEFDSKVKIVNVRGVGYKLVLDV